ncbi:hypothetical protein E2C01_036446 [Portunus trituberculatus]|uniref:Uncharacterized protein n=1 Tax=Portunus trituberculatus TaxID=210409 RepID=A0A5B7FBD6_PORTR|nr:hypothetical protein [Portunus trituberculatus]
MEESRAGVREERGRGEGKEKRGREGRWAWSHRGHETQNTSVNKEDKLSPSSRSPPLPPLPPPPPPLVFKSNNVILREGRKELMNKRKSSRSEVSLHPVAAAALASCRASVSPAHRLNLLDEAGREIKLRLKKKYMLE